MRTHQPTRTNLEIIENNGTVTEILEPGCAPSAAKLSALEAACKKCFSTKSEAVSMIFSGSLPAGAPVDRYAGLIQLAHEFRCLADSPGSARLEDIRRFQKEIPVQTLEAGL